MQNIVVEHWKVISIGFVVGLQLYLFLNVIPNAGEDSYLGYLRDAAWREQSSNCSSTVEQFIKNHSVVLSTTPNASHMLYFLHIPRTAGRTFHSCFLKVSHKPSRRCARSYDVLRLNESLSGCNLLGSHDDYSATEFLPFETAVITQVRDPVERILSAYEFAIEVAARGAFGRRPSVSDEKLSTLAVWPWSYLVPWLEKDIRERRQRRISAVIRFARGLSSRLGFKLRLDPYNNHLVMPLREFVSHPFVTELLHNGAALQVLGATNYSHWAGAGELRACLSRGGAPAELVKEAALRRLRSFLHVGVQEALDDSLVTLAAQLGLSLASPAYKSSVDLKAEREDGASRLQAITNTLPGLEKVLEGRDSQRDAAPANETSWQNLERKVARLRSEQQELQQLLGRDGKHWNATHSDARHVTGRTVGAEFRECAATGRKLNAKRRKKSLARLFHKQPGFSREARALIPPGIIASIRKKNGIDTAVYEEARSLLTARLDHLRQQNMLQALPPEDELEREAPNHTTAPAASFTSSRTHLYITPARLLSSYDAPKA